MNRILREVELEEFEKAVTNRIGICPFWIILVMWSIHNCCPILFDQVPLANQTVATTTLSILSSPSSSPWLLVLVTLNYNHCVLGEFLFTYRNYWSCTFLLLLLRGEERRGEARQGWAGLALAFIIQVTKIYVDNHKQKVFGTRKNNNRHGLKTIIANHWLKFDEKRFLITHNKEPLG